MKIEFAKFINKTDAVIRGDFTLKNGSKSNIFFNFGNICCGREMYTLGTYYAEIILDNDLYEEGDIIFGPAYKGILIAAATSDALFTNLSHSVPFVYNRKTEKTHGESGSFIGYDLNKANGVIIIDDVFTDGGTKLEVIKMLSCFPNIKIKAFVVGINRQEKNDNEEFYIDIFQKKTGIPVYSLTTKEEILKMEG